MTPRIKPHEISIVRSGNLETATIECDRRKLTLTFTMQCGFRKIYSGTDLYIAFGALRADLSEIKFLCNGAKRNVHTSRMSSQMANGLVAYKLTPGRTCETEDLVRIFDYADEEITNNIEEQEEFYRNWIASLQTIAQSSINDDANCISNA